MAASKTYDNASDEINYRLLTLIQNAEAILCDLPKGKDAVVVSSHRPGEKARAPPSKEAVEAAPPAKEEKSVKKEKAKKNCCKCKGSRATDSSSRLSQKSLKALSAWQVADNARGVVVDVSVRVPHRRDPIQMSLDCPKDEAARVLIGEKWHALEEKRSK